MKLCTDHWDGLRRAIADRALWPFVAQGGVEAARRTADTIAAGEPTRDSFEPLMGAMLSITSNTLRVAGPDAMLDGAGCPICRMGADDWITKAADEQLDQARRLELLPSN